MSSEELNPNSDWLKAVEQHIQENGEYDYVNDFYLPINEKEELYADPMVQMMKDNNIDPYEFLGVTKNEGAGVAIPIEDKTELKEGKTGYARAFLDFAKDLPAATFLNVTEGLVNLGNNIIQLGGMASNIAFKKSARLGHIADKTNEFAINANNAAKDQIAKLEQFSKDNDINGMSELLTDLGIDIAAAVPIKKLLDKTPLPKWSTLPLSWGIAYGIGNNSDGTKKNLFLDSDTLNKLNNILDQLPDTPESEVSALVLNTLEGTGLAYAGERLIKVFKLLKNNYPAFINKQTGTATAGGALSAGAIYGADPNNADQVINEGMTIPTEDTIPTAADTEKKNLDQSSLVIPETDNYPPDNLVAGVGDKLLKPIFQSVLKKAAQKIPSKGTGSQILGQLKNTQGVKEAEIKWSGLDDFLKNKKSVTKEEIKDYLEKNSLDVTEVRYGGREDAFSLDLKNRIKSFEDKFYNQQKADLAKDGINMPRMDMNPPNYDRIFVRGVGPDEGINNSFTFSSFDDIYRRQHERHLNPIYKKNRIVSGNTIFEVDEIELEKYLLERDKRLFRKQSNSPKFRDYTEAGGSDYTELVFKLKNPKSSKYPVELEIENSPNKNFNKKSSINYTSPKVHFGTVNEFAHVRFKTRDLDGKKILSIEEMQSDLVQDVLEKRVTAFNPVDKITDFPYKNNWYELTIKRLIRYAADNDFDLIALPKAKSAMARYGQQVDNVSSVQIRPAIGPAGNRVRFVVDYQGAGRRLLRTKTFYENDLDILEKEIGKKNFEKFKPQINELITYSYRLTPDDLVGTYFFEQFEKPILMGSGIGKVNLYDKAIPSFMKKYGKKWNAQVYEDTVDDIPVTILKVTDEMKQSVQQDSQALFNIFGLGSGATLGAKSVKDSIENNTISNQTKN